MTESSGAPVRGIPRGFEQECAALTVSILRGAQADRMEPGGATREWILEVRQCATIVQC